MRWLAGLGMAVVLVAGICLLLGAPRPVPGSPIAAAPVPTTTTTPPEHATSIDDFYRMCDNGKPFSGAPAYRGDGPHSVVLFLNGASAAAYAFDGAPSGAGHLVGAGTIQLVACARPDDSGTTVLRTCQYQGGHSSTLYLANWRFDVYEARTGRPVTSIPVGGDPQAVCPPVMEFEDNEAPGVGVDAPPSDAQFTLLDSLVPGPVR